MFGSADGVPGLRSHRKNSQDFPEKVGGKLRKSNVQSVEITDQDYFQSILQMQPSEIDVVSLDQIAGSS